MTRTSQCLSTKQGKKQQARLSHFHNLQGFLSTIGDSKVAMAETDDDLEPAFAHHAHTFNFEYFEK